MTIRYAAHRVIYYRRQGESSLAAMFLAVLRLLLLEQRIHNSDI
jgi:hypothetical protein